MIKLEFGETYRKLYEVLNGMQEDIKEKILDEQSSLKPSFLSGKRENNVTKKLTNELSIIHSAYDAIRNFYFATNELNNAINRSNIDRDGKVETAILSIQNIIEISDFSQAYSKDTYAPKKEATSKYYEAQDQLEQALKTLNENHIRNNSGYKHNKPLIIFSDEIKRMITLSADAFKKASYDHVFSEKQTFSPSLETIQKLKIINEYKEAISNGKIEPVTKQGTLSKIGLQSQTIDTGEETLLQIADLEKKINALEHLEFVLNEDKSCEWPTLRNTLNKYLEKYNVELKTATEKFSKSDFELIRSAHTKLKEQEKQEQEKNSRDRIIDGYIELYVQYLDFHNQGNIQAEKELEKQLYDYVRNNFLSDDEIKEAQRKASDKYYKINQDKKGEELLTESEKQAAEQEQENQRRYYQKIREQVIQNMKDEGWTPSDGEISDGGPDISPSKANAAYEAEIERRIKRELSQPKQTEVQTESPTVDSKLNDAIDNLASGESFGGVKKTPERLDELKSFYERTANWAPEDRVMEKLKEEGWDMSAHTPQVNRDVINAELRKEKESGVTAALEEFKRSKEKFEAIKQARNAELLGVEEKIQNNGIHK